MCHSKCGAGGGPATFVHRQRGRSGSPRGKEYVEAIQELCSRVGVTAADDTALASVEHDEVREVWMLARPVTSDPCVLRWLQSERGLAPELIVDHDLARVLPARSSLPRWAGFEREGRWRSWPSIGYRVVVPLFDCRGQLGSMRFRAPRPGAKARPASGVSSIGLVMADSVARDVLASSDPPAHAHGGQFSVVLAEGEPDFWSWATEPARSGLGDSAQTFPAVLGVVSGSFDASIAARLPMGTRIISAAHRDHGGDQIHAAIARQLANANRHFTLKRWSDGRGEEI